MRDPRRFITIVAVCLGAIAFGLVAWVGYCAVTLPGCAGCHLEGEFGEQTQASAHASVDCGDCHGGLTVSSRLEFGVAQVTTMYLGIGSTDARLSAVQNTTCSAASCHPTTALSGTTEGSGLRVKHKVCASGQYCADCHASTAHGRAVKWVRSVSMDMCFDCHVKSGAIQECDSCHADKLPTDRVKDPVFAITHGPNHEQTHGMGKMSSCLACHTEAKCAKCHGSGVPHGSDFMERHGRLSVAKGADCQGCHVKDFCTGCHGTPMPHPTEFIKSHGELVDAKGDDACKRCHVSSDCTQCHEKHVHPVALEQLRGLGVLPPDVVR